MWLVCMIWVLYSAYERPLETKTELYKDWIAKTFVLSTFGGQSKCTAEYK